MLPSQQSQPSSISSTSSTETESASPSKMVQTSGSQLICQSSTRDMVLDGRFQHFNKESARVNAGPNIPTGTYDGYDLSSAFSNSQPPIDMDFSSFVVSPSASQQKPTAKDIARSLLHPPPHAFVHKVLSINWVIAVAGSSHFECRLTDGRYILTQDSPLRKWGKQLGLPAVYREWLCGDNEERSAAEDAMWLTQEFFEKEL